MSTSDVNAVPIVVFDKPDSWKEVLQAAGSHLDQKGIDRLRPALDGMVLTTGSSFKRRLSARGMGREKVETLYRFLPMPHFVWVCDISPPEDYEKGLIHD